jgi:hypothetical protein
MGDLVPGREDELWRVVLEPEDLEILDRLASSLGSREAVLLKSAEIFECLDEMLTGRGAAVLDRLASALDIDRSSALEWAVAMAERLGVMPQPTLPS